MLVCEDKYVVALSTVSAASSVNVEVMFGGSQPLCNYSALPLFCLETYPLIDV